MKRLQVFAAVYLPCSFAGFGILERLTGLTEGWPYYATLLATSLVSGVFADGILRQLDRRRDKRSPSDPKLPP